MWLWLKEIKWFIQRGKRGYADCDLWDMYEYHSRITRDMLKSYQDIQHGCPMKYSMHYGETSFNMWSEDVGKMAHAFDLINKLATEDLTEYNSGFDEEYHKICGSRDMTKEEHEEMKNGIRLFMRNYFSLWD